MLWIFFAFTSLANASYQTDILKVRICEELRVNLRELTVESCFNGKFRLTRRADVIDFRWRQGKNLVCGSIYDDANYIHIEICDDQRQYK